MAYYAELLFEKGKIEQAIDVLEKIIPIEIGVNDDIVLANIKALLSKSKILIVCKKNEINFAEKNIYMNYIQSLKDMLENLQRLNQKQ